jgi:hypothetical protein
MATLTHLELQLILAKKSKLIEDFEYIKNRDWILVKFKYHTSIEQKYRLKDHIQTKYPAVLLATIHPHENALYIRYVS